MKFADAFLSFSFSLFLVASICEKLVQIVLAWRNGSNIQVSTILGLISIVALLFLGIFLKKKKLSFKVNDIAKNVKRGRQFYKLCAVTALASCLLFQSAMHSLENTLRFGGHLLAVGLDTLGYYELGERVYANCVQSERDSLASLYHGLRSSRIESISIRHVDQESISKTVEQTYGAKSKQMAFRLLTLGFLMQENFNDYSRATNCYRNAMVIYEQLGDYKSVLECLSFLAFAQNASGQKSGLNETLQQASDVLPFCPLGCEQRNHLKVLSLISNQSNKIELAQRFLEKARL